MTESGWRDDLGAVVHDADDRGDRHRVVFDYATRDDSLDGYRTSWAPHCFRESFRSRPRPPMLWNHNADVMIGSADRCESRLRAWLHRRLRTVIGKFSTLAELCRLDIGHLRRRQSD